MEFSLLTAIAVVGFVTLVVGAIVWAFGDCKKSTRFMYWYDQY